MLLRSFVNLVMGHWHTTQEYIQKRANGELMGAWSVGCLRTLNPRFQPLNRWNHGLAEIDYSPNGQFQVWNLKIQNGRVLGNA